MNNSLWQLSSEELLAEWRSFRLGIKDSDLKTCMEKTQDWWKLMPLGSREIDPYESVDWPDPWELLYNRAWDENVKALGMAYTLHLINHECDVVLIQNTEDGFLGLTVLVDNKWLLNYNYSEIVDADTVKYEVLKKWSTNQLTQR